MARQNINVGTVANDGTGDKLRTGGQLINQNFEELYGIGGFGFYEDDAGGNIGVSTTDTLLDINALGANTTEDYLPREYRGQSDGGLWDEINNLITPYEVGDVYEMRVDLTIASTLSSPTILTIKMDQGGASAPSDVFVEFDIPITKTTPFLMSASINFWARADAVANGIQIWLSTDTGSATISNRDIFIERTFKGSQ